ncbi:hypothetical protein LIER_12166 [Lithospermum erythrorhizon]|uniref:Uncharacterized protein n=1 Tax=Lithospermum erythrorhizon TaxID=34254 RepID=A0AAV3PSF4_LITER
MAKKEYRQLVSQCEEDEPSFVSLQNIFIWRSDCDVFFLSGQRTPLRSQPVFFFLTASSPVAFMAGDGVGEPPPPSEGGCEHSPPPVDGSSLPSQPQTRPSSSSSNPLHQLVNQAPADSMDGGPVAATHLTFEPPQNSKIPTYENPKTITQAPPPLSFDGGASAFTGDSLRATSYAHRTQPPAPNTQPSLISTPAPQAQPPNTQAPNPPSSHPSSNTKQVPPHIPTPDQVNSSTYPPVQTSRVASDIVEKPLQLSMQKQSGPSVHQSVRPVRGPARPAHGPPRPAGPTDLATASPTAPHPARPKPCTSAHAPARSASPSAPSADHADRSARGPADHASARPSGLASANPTACPAQCDTSAHYPTHYPTHHPAHHPAHGATHYPARSASLSASPADPAHGPADPARPAQGSHSKAQLRPRGLGPSFMSDH